MRIRIQRIAIILMLLAFLLIPLGLGLFANSPVTQVEVFNGHWWRELKGGIEAKNWQKIEAALVDTPSEYGQRAAAFAFAAHNMINIEDNKEVKVLFDRLLDFRNKHDFGGEFNLSLALSAAYESRLGKVIATEEQELQQILELAEKNISTLDRQVASDKLRDILARMTYPLEFSRIRLACFERYAHFSCHYNESNFPVAVALRDLDAYLESKVDVMERLIKLTIQLNVNASDIANLAFNPLFESARKIDSETDRSKSIWLMGSALNNNLAMEFPQSPIPRTLSNRLEASGLMAPAPVTLYIDVYGEEMKLEQALRIAENTQVFDTPKSVASRLRGVLAQVNTPLMFPTDEIPSGVGQGEIADAVQTHERLSIETAARLKRIIILAIQLDAPDLADIAFSRSLKSTNGGEGVGYIARTLEDIAKQYPDSYILQGLKARLGKR
jgi:hypothetical protein